MNVFHNNNEKGVLYHVLGIYVMIIVDYYFGLCLRLL